MPTSPAPAAVLFDLDGTLLDTLEDIARAANAVLAAAGQPTHAAAAYRLFVGEGVTALMTRALPGAMRDADTVRRLGREFLDAYERGWKETTRPYAGVASLLDGLTARGIGLMVLSNKPHAFTCLCVDEFLGKWSFVQVAGMREGVPPKPDPAGALDLARRAGIAPGRILYVGDSAVDMKTARRAGMPAVGVLWGFRDRQELETAGATAIVARPEEVLAIVDGDGISLLPA